MLPPLSFDTATLRARARECSKVPLRRGGSLVELVIVGVATCLGEQAAGGWVGRASGAGGLGGRAGGKSTAVLWGSMAGIRAATARIVTDLVLAGETPLPFDFLATQPILAAVPLQQSFPCIENVLYQPWNDDTELHWRRMRTLAVSWLQTGRYARVLCGQVEPDDDEHHGQWQIFEKCRN
jgi:hypothetical protein